MCSCSSRFWLVVMLNDTVVCVEVVAFHCDQRIWKRWLLGNCWRPQHAAFCVYGDGGEAIGRVTQMQFSVARRTTPYNSPKEGVMACISLTQASHASGARRNETHDGDDRQYNERLCGLWAK